MTESDGIMRGSLLPSQYSGTTIATVVFLSFAVSRFFRWKKCGVADEVCASCGVAVVDEKKLKDCDGGCGLVKYCSDVCQDVHREHHEEECLRDKKLFTQPDFTHEGECPICCLPMSVVSKESALMPCCITLICRGCEYANKEREKEARMQQRCAFCREPVPKSQAEARKKMMKRVKKNDPVAICQIGTRHYQEGDYGTALRYYTKAAKLGDAEAHYVLSIMYRQGVGVEKDAKKEIHHLEEAAMKGHPRARFNLGIVEKDNGRFERAKKHHIIAANLGLHESLQALRQLYADGYATKEDYAGALRAYQTAVDATKSEERERAEKAIKSGEMRYAF
jgi:hypothetical protein